MNAFQAACGLRRPIRLKIQNGRGESRLLRLDRPFAVVGRNPAADIRLDHEQVCLRHAYLQVVQGRLWAIDLSVWGGLQWPPGRPARCGLMRPGEPVRIGPFTILALDDAGPTDSAAEDPLHERPPGPPPTLRGHGAETGGESSWSLNRTIDFLGRSSFCRVRIDDVGISRTHAAMVRTPVGLWIVDLLGRGGLLVNGIATRFGRLETDDVLNVGPHQFTLHRGGELATTWPRIPRPADPRAQEPFTNLEPIRPDLVSPATTPGWPSEGGTALLMLIEQMGQSQQRMLDQFQQTMRMLFELVGERQREDQSRLHEELDRLHQLTEELTGLKASLKAPARAERAGPEPTGLGSASPGPRPGLHGRSTTGPQVNSLAWVCQRLDEMRTEQEDRWGRVARILRRPGG